MKMPMEELRALLNREGISTWNWILADPSFETVSFAWVAANWEAWMNARPDELVVFGYAGGRRVRERPIWIADSSDCDNMAIGTLVHAQVGNALSAVKTGTNLEQRSVCYRSMRCIAYAFAEDISTCEMELLRLFAAKFPFVNPRARRREWFYADSIAALDIFRDWYQSTKIPVTPNVVLDTLK